MHDHTTPGWVDASSLTAPVSRLLDVDVDSIESWSGERLVGGAGEALGVWRISGTARTCGTTAPWTMILKGWPPFEGADDPTGWNWPRREARAYGSGVLDDLPGGIRAPHCLGSEVLPDGSEWAWLTPLSDGSIESWSLDHFALVARHLGRFNGAYLVDTPIPDAPWLSKHWTSQWTEAASGFIDLIEAHADHPLVRRACPPALVSDLARTWAERHTWLAVLDSLPQTFCHLDVFTRNVFLAPGPDDVPEPRLIDWGFSGVAAVGEEIGPMAAATLIFDPPHGVEPPELERTVLDGYLAGLRDAGWSGDDLLVRLGYTGSVALRYGPGAMRVVLMYLLNEPLYPAIEEIYGRSIEAIADRAAERHQWSMQVGEEFRRLVQSAPAGLTPPR